MKDAQLLQAARDLAGFPPLHMARLVAAGMHLEADGQQGAFPDAIRGLVRVLDPDASTVDLATVMRHCEQVLRMSAAHTNMKDPRRAWLAGIAWMVARAVVDTVDAGAGAPPQ